MRMYQVVRLIWISCLKEYKEQEIKSKKSKKQTLGCSIKEEQEIRKNHAKGKGNHTNRFKSIAWM